MDIKMVAQHTIESDKFIEIDIWEIFKMGVDYLNEINTY